MIILGQIPFELDFDELREELRVEADGPDAAKLRDLAEAVVPIARPKAAYRLAFVEERGEETVTIDGIVFTSKVLRANLDDVERVFPHVATCGREIDLAGLVDPSDIVALYWLDMMKERALGAAVRFLNSHLKAAYGLEKYSKMSPGAGAHDVWRIEQQRELFRLLGGANDSIGVILTPSCLMVPNKSVSGIFFPTEKSFEACRLCPRDECKSRVAPYDAELARSYQERAFAPTGKNPRGSTV